MFERFTASARHTVVTAWREADQLHHPYIGTEHLLLAMLAEHAGVAAGVLRAAGVDHARVKADVERLIAAPPKLLTEQDAVALRAIGIDLDAVLARIEEKFGLDALARPQPPARRGLLRGRRAPHGRFTRRSKKVLELSLREAVRLGDNAIGTEHLLLGLLRDGDGLAVKVLTDAGLTVADLRAATLTALGKAA